MKPILKKIFLTALIVAIYFALWRDFRGVVTQYTILPQIEYSTLNCDLHTYTDQSKPTSFVLYVYDDVAKQYDSFPYTTPAGFYLLFGLVMILLLDAKKLHYQLMVGFHLVLWILTIVVFYPALCFSPTLLHFNTIAIKYFTPFITFLIIVMVLSPTFQKRLDM